jgi:hypothetical protein
MTRCAPLTACLAALLFAGGAQAQSPRQFPANALRGELVVTLPPEVLLNRQPARLAPGAKLRGMDNMLVMSGAAIGQRLAVHYTLDLQGQLLNVWVLTPQELARQPWPSTLEEAQRWQFNADAQTWSRP